MSNSTLYTLQLLRFIASLLVLLFHLNILTSGYKGVDIFFVISGFVMYYTLFYKTRPSVYTFIIHRATKIFFLYWVALIFLFFIQPYVLNAILIKTLLLLPGHVSILGVSWSLSYELYFYFLAGVIAYLIPEKYHTLLLVFLFAVSSLITLGNLTSLNLKGTIINFLLGANFWEFLLGIGAAYLALWYNKIVLPKIMLAGSLICMLLLLSIAIKYTHPISYLVYGILSFFIVTLISAYDISRIGNLRIMELFKILGDSSYAIYLFGPIITIIVPENSNYSKLFVILATISFSLIFNQLVEKNFLLWIRKKLITYSKLNLKKF